jgi:hypothetical protein
VIPSRPRYRYAVALRWKLVWGTPDTEKESKKKEARIPNPTPKPNFVIHRPFSHLKCMKVAKYSYVVFFVVVFGRSGLRTKSNERMISSFREEYAHVISSLNVKQ